MTHSPGGAIHVPRDLGLTHPFVPLLADTKTCGVNFHFKEMEAKVMNPVVISDLLLVSCNSLTNSHVTHKCEAMTYYG